MLPVAKSQIFCLLPVAFCCKVYVNNISEIEMKQLNRALIETQNFPTKIMQFGEGNFLRAFVDWQINQLNKQTDLNAGIAIIRPIDYDQLPLLNTQDGLYTCIIRGINEQGEATEEITVIESVNEEVAIYKDFTAYLNLAENPDIQFIFSNTTEAGIEFLATDKLDDKPAAAFPAKLTQWLLHRYTHFNGDDNKGVIIIPCELIDYNGDKLKQIVLEYCALWSLDQAFVDWINNANDFCSTLVDRIVTGYPRDEINEIQTKLGYQDTFVVTSEYFHLFVIQGPEKLSSMLRLEESDLNIIVVDDIYPYKQRKVAILNGAHTAMVPVALLSGINTVGEAMDDELLSKFVEQGIFSEIIPTLNLPKDELHTFAKDVIKRFKNPYIKHQLISIALNSMTKFTTRIMPQLVKFVEQNQTIPTLLSLALAAQILLYKGQFNDMTFDLNDDPKWLSLFTKLWQEHDAGNITSKQLVSEVLSDSQHWQANLQEIPNLIDTVTDHLESILTQGIEQRIALCLEKGN